MIWVKNAFAIEQKKTNELTDRERAVLEKLAGRINRHGMTLPAVVFLESVKPLGFVAGQAMVFFRPFVSAFFDTAEYDLLASMLEDRNTIEILLNRIEALGQKAAEQ
ncbi:MAG: hypothetical protein ACYTBJ_03580 [Planctomycetota bacterium]|jgi:hypothetical protein